MHIRFITNVRVKVQLPDGGEEKRVFMFGECHAAKQIEIVEEDYVTILLKDGRVIPGLDKRNIENFGVPVVASSLIVDTPQEAEEVEHVVNDEDGKKIPVDGTMLGRDG